MKKATAIILVLCFLVPFSACGTGSKPGQAANVLSALKSQSVFSYFEQICAIPRGSDNTQAISNFVAAFAQEQELDYDQDEHGNVLIFKPAAKGFEGREPIALQCHIDMVYVAADASSDTTHKAVTPVTDGRKLWAADSSLGGDNGIGTAIIMSILADKKLQHPPLEAIFTINEETNFEGAYTVNVSLLKSKRILNLDAEQAGSIYVSSAGGKVLDITIPVKTQKLSNQKVFKLTLSGLTGGHSGENIKFGRANAIKQTGELLYAALNEFDLTISEWNGGVSDNAIPTDTYVLCSVSPKDTSDFESFVGSFGDKLKAKFSDTDPDMELTIETAGKADAEVIDENLKRIVTAIHEIPDGVIKMSEVLDGNPETSLNIGVIKLSEGELKIKTLIRSSNMTALNEVVNEFAKIVKASGGKYTISADFPTWEYVEESSLRELVQSTYKSVTGKNAVIKITHAALECGVFYERMGGDYFHRSGCSKSTHHRGNDQY